MTREPPKDCRACHGTGWQRTTDADWKDALELAHLWAGYWEDMPAVHMDTAQVGMLARSFLAAMIVLGIIAKPEALSAGDNQ